MGAGLKDLKIDRVDGVDDPATGRRFMLTKSEDLDDLLGNLDTLQKATAEAFEALAKDDVTFSKDTAAKLSKLAEVCDIKAVLKCREEAKAKDATTAATAPPASNAAPADALVSALGKMTERFDAVAKSLEGLPEKITERIEKAFEDDEELVATGASRSVESSQPPEAPNVHKSSAREFGKGMFANVVFPRVARR